MILCPDCAQGKHQACVGWAWDAAADREVPCPCPDPSHAEEAKP